MATHSVSAHKKIVLRDFLQGARPQTTLTISNGGITPVSGSHIVAAQTGNADDLTTITFAKIAGAASSGDNDDASAYKNALRAGDVFELTADAGDTITVKHNAVNILTVTGEDIVLDSPSKTLRCKVNTDATGVFASLASGVTPKLFEMVGSGGTTFDIAKVISAEDYALVLYGGATVAKSAYSIAADTPAAGQTRFTFDFTLADGVPVSIFA